MTMMQAYIIHSLIFEGRFAGANENAIEDVGRYYNSITNECHEIKTAYFIATKEAQELLGLLWESPGTDRPKLIRDNFEEEVDGVTVFSTSCLYRNNYLNYT